MRTRLPSMTSLRAFEAAARHLSFTRAAVELNLTQTAISHQIRNLEELLGTKLFVRNGNAVTLTEVANGYLQSVRNALVEISAATDMAADRNDENVLTLQCLGTFAIKRLVPVLHLFQARYPSISLRLRTVQSFESNMPHDFDLAVWHGSGDWPGVTVDKLGEEQVFPVCSPRLLAERGKLETPADLSNHTVIRTVSLILRDEWPFWLETAGVRDISFGAELTCDYLITSMQAAVDGLGVVLGRSGVVGPDLASGRLVEPFSVRARSNFGYYLVTPLRTAKLRKVQLFRRWLLEQVNQTARTARELPGLTAAE
ncbi:transcriptional regulator GcvA [Enterovirga aerilata]|uniref:Transcriptional regulator GcvA n=1 Tax=Enterovirga aerilata TaxID=2730920 RepID=A0A849I0F6_9HYPH|nr:transcriptional regulator GcvA [Enterovirga sp. DB1703]NNM72822.1 transcriptional regulator GcvA [Enterovirga sp. DB1703]